jgi:hypothetical protein
MDKECKFEGCSRRAVTKSFGLCHTHNEQRKSNTPLTPIRQWTELSDQCLHSGCQVPPIARNLCATHYQRLRQHGDTKDRRGGWRIGNGGYVVRKENYRIILQHREIMSQHLGRELLPEENVHHINGDKTDNRIENLELWSTSQPAGQRVEDKLAWAKEILGLYGTVA